MVERITDVVCGVIVVVTVWAIASIGYACIIAGLDLLGR